MHEGCPRGLPNPVAVDLHQIYIELPVGRLGRLFRREPPQEETQRPALTSLHTRGFEGPVHLAMRGPFSVLWIIAMCIELPKVRAEMQPAPGDLQGSVTPSDPGRREGSSGSHSNGTAGNAGCGARSRAGRGAARRRAAPAEEAPPLVLGAEAAAAAPPPSEPAAAAPEPPAAVAADAEAAAGRRDNRCFNAAGASSSPGSSCSSPLPPS